MKVDEERSDIIRQLIEKKYPIPKDIDECGRGRVEVAREMAQMHYKDMSLDELKKELDPSYTPAPPKKSRPSIERPIKDDGVVVIPPEQQKSGMLPPAFGMNLYRDSIERIPLDAFDESQMESDTPAIEFDYPIVGFLIYKGYLYVHCRTSIIGDEDNDEEFIDDPTDV